MSGPLAEAAIALHLPVFPCDADKRPLTKRGFKDATTDPAKLRRMFRHPSARLIGMPTGRISGLIVLDIDVKNGKRGMEWYDAHEMGGTTRTHRTASGGLHLLYRAPDAVEIRNSAGRISDGVDVRGIGGYFIHSGLSRFGYGVVCDLAPAAIPEWLLALMLPPAEPERPKYKGPPPTVDGDYARRALVRAIERVLFSPQGARNDTLNRQAFRLGTFVGAGLLDLGEVAGELAHAGASVGLSNQEIKATLNSGLRAGMARPMEASHGR